MKMGRLRDELERPDDTPIKRGKQKKQPEQILIPFLLERIEADPIAYKPYSPKLVPVGPVVVMMPMDTIGMMQDSKEQVIITLDGFMSILSNLSTAIEEMHQTRLQR